MNDLFSSSDEMQISESQIYDRSEYIEKVVRNVNALRNQKKAGFAEYRNVIGISGARGVGKSTILHAARKELRKNPHDLVLDVISPSDINVTESIISVVMVSILYQLKQKIAEYEKEKDPLENKPDGNPIYNLNSFQERLISIALGLSRSAKIALPSIQRNAAAGDEFSWQLIQAEQSLYESKRFFNEWLEEFMEYYSSLEESNVKERGMLIISLDDFDLFPDLLPRAVTDIGRYLQSDRIAVLMAFTDDAMVRAVAHHIVKPYTHWLEQLEKLKLLDQQTLAREVDDYICKLIPDSQRVSLPKWERPLEQLTFEPPNRQATLLQLLERIKLDKSYKITSFAELFDLSGIVDFGNEVKKPIPSFFCEILPKTARGLYNLYEALWNFIEFYPHDKPISEGILVRLLKTIYDICISDIPHVDRNEVGEVVYFTPNNQIEFNFNGLAFGVIGTRGRSIYKTDSHKYIKGLLENRFDKSMGKIGNLLPYSEEESPIVIYSFMISDFYTRRIVVLEDKRRYLRPVKYGCLVQFLFEFAVQSLNLIASRDGDPGFLGLTRWSNHIKVKVDNKETDDLFLIIPEYEFYLPYYIYACAWNEWMRQIHQYKNEKINEIGKTSLIVDYFALRHIALILDIELGDIIEVGNLLKGDNLFEFLETDLISRKEKLIEKTRQYLQKKCDGRFMGYNQFIINFFACIIHASSRLFISKNLLKWFRETLLFEIYKFKTKELKLDIMLNNIEQRYTETQEDSNISASFLADHLEIMYCLDPKLFEEKSTEYYKKWENFQEKKIKGQIDIAQHLVNNGVITKEEALRLLKDGLIPPIMAKIAGLPEENRNFILSVFPVIKKEEDFFKRKEYTETKKVIVRKFVPEPTQKFEDSSPDIKRILEQLKTNKILTPQEVEILLNKGITPILMNKLNGLPPEILELLLQNFPPHE